VTDNHTDLTAEESVHQLVRDGYGAIASRASSCCGPSTPPDTRLIAQNIGYSLETLDAVPEEANLGLGCGNPTALASLQPGDVVVDLGAGAGLDALVAARAVGPQGRVIGVDMTQQMLTSARKNAVDMGVHGFVEFREGLIENLPVAAESADVVISNCVINLSPDKPTAFREAFRVLKPGGRLAVSDIVLSSPLPEELLGMAEAYVACLSGASTEDDYLAAIRGAGFVDVEFTRVAAGPLFLGDFTDPMIQKAVEVLGKQKIEALADTVFSYKITARKP